MRDRLRISSSLEGRDMTHLFEFLGLFVCEVAFEAFGRLIRVLSFLSHCSYS